MNAGPENSFLQGAEEKLSADVILQPPNPELVNRIPKTPNVIAIGASTGGVDAIRAILVQMPIDCAGIVIVQPMPEQFTEPFAQRLNELCQIEVREAKKGERIEPDLALVSPRSHHLVLKRSGQNYFVDTVEGLWSTAIAPRSMYCSDRSRLPLVPTPPGLC